ncbi:MAG: LLM class flavin-dependent oxidoreductase [Myxococcales bacterium]|nr:LLM class flavin-dependent oxidoreductase [Myxococcales bacterium]
MKFGVLQFFSWPERRVPLQTVYARALERIEIMDQSGYDAVWLAEHHFTGYSVCPSVHLMALQAASRTKNLRIGTAVSLAALYHPLRLAEEVALLDVLTGGRINWGAGRGFDPAEFRAFGVPVEESAARFREAVEIVLAAWQSERLSWQGKYWTFEDLEVLPKPHQDPHPPVWVAATSRSAVEWAASRGFSILMDPHATHAELARKREFYRESLEANGHSIAGRELPMARLFAVAETDAEAEAVARRGAAWTVGAYVNPEKSSGHAVGADRHFTEPVRDPVERYLDGVIVYGTPERVIDQLRALREEMFLDSLLCAHLSHASFELFTERVLPAFV